MGGSGGGSGISGITSRVDEAAYSSATPYWFLSDGSDGYGAEVAELVDKFVPDYTAADTGQSGWRERQ